MERILRPGIVLALAALGGAAFGGPQADVLAAAAAAGTLFEATPFLFAAFWLERHALARPFLRRPLARGIAVAGCGCAHGALPGALALPGIALTALTFGPAVAAARVAAGTAIAIVRARRSASRAHDSANGGGAISNGGDACRRDAARSTLDPSGSDPLYALERIGASAFVASLAVAAFSANLSGLPWPWLLFAGLLLGALAPCATAGVAMAAASAHAAPAASAGMLATAGLITVALPRTRIAGPAKPASAAMLLLGSACAALAVRGPSGLVNPRLLVPLAVASCIAFATSSKMRTRSARPIALPVLMLGMLVAPPELPPPRADATRLDEAFAGEPLAFTGVASHDAASTTLARYAITCCRLDATAIAVRLDRALSVPDGRWIDARGTLVRGIDGTLVLHADRIRQTAAPADPFVYR